MHVLEHGEHARFESCVAGARRSGCGQFCGHTIRLETRNNIAGIVVVLGVGVCCPCH